MLRAAIKGGGLFLIGSLPGGTGLYRRVTREIMGTQRGHILKLQRIWPEVIEVCTEAMDGPLEGKRILSQDCGYSPFLACVNYLICGNGGVLLNTGKSHARLLEAYTTESINHALDIADGLNEITPVPPRRVRVLDALRWRRDFKELLDETGTLLLEGVERESIPLETASVDMVFSGGSQEHYHPEELRAWVKEAARVLRPGGFTEVILDHREHLYHYDFKLPFLHHYAVPDGVYHLTHGNPLLYHNRLTPPEVRAMFGEAGLEEVRVLRRALPSDTWFEEGGEVEADTGIERRRLQPRFRSLSDVDLKTAAAMYVFRKPTARQTQ